MKSIYLKGWMLIWLVLIVPYTSYLFAGELADCEKPLDLASTEISENGATLIWTALPGHLDYKIEVRSKGRTSKFKWESETSNSSIRIEGLMPGSNYKFRVKAKCDDDGSSGSSPWNSFQTGGMNPDESCSKATNLEVMGLSGTTAVLAWNGGEHASHYEVEVRSKGKTPTYFFAKSLLDNMVTISGLAPDGKYQFRVKTTCENGAYSGSTSWFAFMSTIIENDTCSSPTAIEVNEVTATTALASWTMVEQAEGYEVFLIGPDSAFGDTVFTVLSTSIVLEDLLPDASFEIQVRTLCAFGISDDFAVANFATLALEEVSCTAPVNANAQVTSDTSAILSWTPADSGATYRVTWMIASDSTINETVSSDTSVFLSGLIPATNYSAHIQTLCTDTTSDLVALEFVTTDSESDSCMAPQEVSANNITDTSAIISWQEDTSAEEYVVNLIGPDTTLAFVIQDTFIFLRSLQDSTNYSVGVITVCTEGQSSETSIIFTTSASTMDSVLCTAPTNLGAFSQDSAFLLTWTAELSVDSFRLELKEVEQSQNIIDSSLTAALFVFTELDTGTFYEFRVSSICDTNQISEPSDWFAFPGASDSTLTLVCDPPTEFNVDTTTAVNAHVTWQGGDSALYQIQVQTGDSIWSFILQTDTTSASLMLFDLDPSTGYRVRVRSVCDDENSAYTEWIDFVTTEEMVICVVPSNQEVIVINDSTVNLFWSGPDSATFHVEVATTDTISQINLALPSDINTIAVSGLNAITEYQFRVQSICNDGDTSSFSDWFIFTTADTIGVFCFAPLDIDLDTISMTSAGLSWQGPDDANFTAEVEAIDTMVDFMAALELVVPEVTLDSLSPGTDYRIRVKSLCENEESDFSDWFNFSTLSDTTQEDCEVPENLQLDSISSQSAWLSWTGPDEIEFKLKLMTVDSEDSTLTHEEMTVEQNIAFQGLTSHTNYALLIKSICGENSESDYADTLFFTTLQELADTCQTPVGEMIEVEMEYALVSWTSSSPGALYLLEVEHLGLTHAYNLITTTYDTAYLIDGLLPGGNYQWKITAFCASDSYSECSPWMAFITEVDQSEVGCQSPKNLNHSELDPSSAKLHWNSLPNHVDYEVEIQSLDTTSFFSQVNITTDTFFQVDGLMSGGLYQFKVNALCSSGDVSEDSEWYEFSMSEGDTMTIGDQRGQLILAYPNPVIERMTVEMPEDNIHGKTMIELTDLAGRIVLSEWRHGVIRGDRLDFGVSEIREGVYKLSVKSTAAEYHQLIFITE